MPPEILCPECETCFDYGWVPPRLIDARDDDYELDRQMIGIPRKLDLGATFDCREIASQRFKDVVCGLFPLEDCFHRVFDKPAWYYFLPKEIVELDAERNRPRLLRPCSRCGGFGDVMIGPGLLSLRRPLPHRGFFRSDLAFASNREKSPLIITDEDTVKILKSHKFRGIVYDRLAEPISA